jgi:hypothetical protein
VMCTMIVASISPSARGCQWSNAVGSGKSSGPVLTGGVGVGRAVGGSVSVGGGVSVATCGVGVDVAAGGALVGGCVTVACGARVGRASIVRVGDGAWGVGVGALQARMLATSPIRARVISVYRLCISFLGNFSKGFRSLTAY